MAVREISRLGNPKLYETSIPVERADLRTLKQVVQDLHDTMMNFREEYQAGRAIAAPQISVMKRLVYMKITGPVVFINPVITPQDDAMMEVWDDCMCFPDLLVKVLRYRSCRVTYRDLDWQERAMNLEGDLSELLQHEVDHLDGILAVWRAVDGRSFALRSQRHLLSSNF